MKYLLLLGVLRVSISTYSKTLSDTMFCECSQSTNEGECIMNECVWNDNECSDRECVTINGSSCDSEPNDIFEPVDCYTLRTQGQCKGQNKNYDYCVWSEEYNLCKSVYVYYCADADRYGQQYCDDWACVWESNKCVEAQCSKYTNEENCNYYYDVNYLKIYICNWNRYRCEDANDLSQRNQHNCMADTEWRAMWNQELNACQWCVPSLLSLQLYLIMLTFLSI